MTAKNSDKIEFCKTLFDAMVVRFSIQNVKREIDSNQIRIRPYWIEQTNVTCKQDVNSMVDLVGSFLEDFDSSKKYYCVMKNIKTGLPYFCVYLRKKSVEWNELSITEQVDHRMMAIITLHHNNFF